MMLPSCTPSSCWSVYEATTSWGFEGSGSRPDTRLKIAFPPLLRVTTPKSDRAIGWLQAHFGVPLSGPITAVADVTPGSRAIAGAGRVEE